MTDRKTLEGIVTAIYDARAQSDRNTLMDWAGPGFSFCLAGSEKLAPMTGRISDPAAVDAALQQLFEDWDMSKMQTMRLYVDGDTVFAHRAGPIRFIPTGKEVQTEYIDRFTFKDGKIIDLTEFVDTLMVAETVGLIQAPHLEPSFNPAN